VNDQLEEILKIAATAPGNWQRFQAAGLLADCLGNDSPQLVADWPSRFSQLPPVSRAEMRRLPGQFLASVSDIVFRGTTSGTSGQHFIYFADHQWNHARQRARRRSLAWWGIDDFTPMINVASRLFPVRPCDMAIAGEPTLELIDRLLAQLAITPAALRGYPSRLCQIAAALTGQQLPLVIAVVCTGEPLFDFQRTLLEKVFNAPVVNEYGCQESGISGLSCPEYGHLHLDSDRCFYELVDGQLVTTDVFNRVMPMVRYQSGDALELDPDPCPCGRPGQIARVLGRVEQPGSPGYITMPALPGILSYQAIQANPHQVTLRAVPDSSHKPVQLQPLLDWAGATFGDVETRVVMQSPELPAAPPPAPCSTTIWIQTITRGSWAHWCQHPQFPDGEAYSVAQLLHQLIHPSVIRYNGLPFATWTLLQAVLNQVPSRDNAIAQITARVLLFSCCFLASDPAVNQIYENAAQRLQNSRVDDPECLSWEPLIATLFLDTERALAIWQDWFQEMDRGYPDQPPSWAIDGLTIQHLLYALEPAVQRAYRHLDKKLQPLRPLVSVLVGDLSCFAPLVGPWLLAHWFHLLHQQPLPDSPWLRPADPFANAWLTWRTQLLTDAPAASLTELEQMARCSEGAAARTPAEQERVALERAYGLLVNQQVPDPEQWLPILRQIQDQARGLAEQEIDPVPWHPLLKALVAPLLARGERTLAYDCLVTATTPSSRLAAFERFALRHNYKQNVLGRFEF
jgi:hypothetical protein